MLEIEGTKKEAFKKLKCKKKKKELARVEQEKGVGKADCRRGSDRTINQISENNKNRK